MKPSAKAAREKKDKQEQQERMQEQINPPWYNAESISFAEKLELSFYKSISYVPVFITFCLFSLLVAFYVCCYLYPCLVGDFQSTIGIQDYWANESERDSDIYAAQIYAGIFSFCALTLLLSILLTIFTSPGTIPSDIEWDMPSIDLGMPNGEEQTEEDFINQELMEDTQDPTEAIHFEYRFIKSKAGPLYKNSDCSAHQIATPMFPPVSYERKNNGGIRMCQRCLRTKPDRTHHCSQCNKCILKMDHHCPWVANCIGFYNYKYFLNMIFYASVTSMLVTVTSYPVFIAVLAQESIDTKLAYFIVTSWLLTLFFCFIITGFFSFHIWLLSNQYTTIEFCEKRTSADSRFSHKSPYNRGCCSNFSTVLGRNFLLWCFPCNRSLKGEGLTFEIRDELKQPAPEDQAPLLSGDKNESQIIKDERKTGI